MKEIHRTGATAYAICDRNNVKYTGDFEDLCTTRVLEVMRQLNRPMIYETKADNWSGRQRKVCNVMLWRNRCPNEIRREQTSTTTGNTNYIACWRLQHVFNCSLNYREKDPHQYLDKIVAKRDFMKVRRLAGVTS